MEGMCGVYGYVEVAVNHSGVSHFLYKVMVAISTQNMYTVVRRSLPAFGGLAPSTLYYQAPYDIIHIIS